MIDFKETYKAPFVVKNDGMYGICSNKTKAFTAFTSGAMEHLKRIISILNNESDKTYNPNEVVVRGTRLCINGELIIVRGWGKLTGSGGFAIPVDEAAKIQDSFIDWVVKKITGR